MTEDTWLIWSNEHSAWWAPNGRGYTNRTAEAGRYPFMEALGICKTYRPEYSWSTNEASRQPMEVMVPSPEQIADRQESVGAA